MGQSRNPRLAPNSAVGCGSSSAVTGCSAIPVVLSAVACGSSSAIFSRTGAMAVTAALVFSLTAHSAAIKVIF